MDLVDYDEDVFAAHLRGLPLAGPRGSRSRTSRCIPISALQGDNVVDRSARDALVRRAAAARATSSTSHVAADRDLTTLRFPVQ